MRKVTILLLLTVLAAAPFAFADSGYFADAESQYPNIVGTKLDSCSLCHTSSIPARNPYGAAYASAGHSFTSIEDADSDGDGASNFDEIIALTWPGDATDTPTGSVQVTIGPPDAISAGAQWRLDAGTYQNSGATVSGVVVGNHTVQFKAIDGWAAPADSAITVAADQTATASGTYTQQQQTTIVPNVVGMTQAAATSAIANAGFSVGTVTEAPSETVPAGQVISQNPAAGTSAAPGSAVSFVVSTGGATATAPELGVSPHSRSVGSASGVTSFEVSNVGSGALDWTASVATGGDWLTITSGSAGTNAGAIQLSFGVNAAASSRNGSVRVTASGAAGSPAEVTVTQAGQQSPGDDDDEEEEDAEEEGDDGGSEDHAEDHNGDDEDAVQASCTYKELFRTEWPLLAADLGLGQNTAQESEREGRIRERWAIAMVRWVLCSPYQHPLLDQVMNAYQANLAALESEPAAVAERVAPYRHVLAALLLVSQNRQDRLKDLLGLQNDYVVVHKPDKAAISNEPFSDLGDLDNDSITNVEEYQRALLAGSSISAFAYMAADSSAANLEPTPVAGTAGTALLAGILVFGGLAVLRIRRRRRRQTL